MEIYWQVLLLTWESCANVAFQSCELFIMRCTLSQTLQLVGKTTLIVCTQ